MNFKINESDEKLRGSYYTPLPIAEYLCAWVLRNDTKSILEPSCGDGIFFEALNNIVKKRKYRGHLKIEAVELIKKEAEKATKRLSILENNGFDVSLSNTDFFKWITSQNGTRWDAIIGNPPYIRYQYFDKTQRERSELIFKSADVKFSALTNAWVPFVIGSVSKLSPGGRIAMVLPSEIQYILHAEGLRKLLEKEMEEISIIHFRDIVFKDALQGVVLFMATKKGNGVLNDNERTKLRIYEVNGIEELSALKMDEKKRYSFTPKNGDKWTKALLSPKEIEICHKIEENSNIFKFGDLASIDIGIVTGANSYFVVNQETLKKYRLKKYSSPMLAKSDLIRGIRYTKKDHIENVNSDRAVYFLDFNKYDKKCASENIEEYIKLGEEMDLPKRYKCRIRSPWYGVPYIWKSNIAMLKRCHNFPRLVLNQLGAYSTDTAYRIKLNKNYAGRSKDIVFSFINSLTFLYAELYGRHYGGGVLELVPSEISKLYLPIYKCDTKQFDILDHMIRSKTDITDILAYTDSLVLKSSGLSENEIDSIKNALLRLRNRRLRI